jgi:hypothetical protein
MDPYDDVRFAALRTQALHWLREEQGHAGPVTLRYSADLRYRGQSYELEAELPEAAAKAGDIATLAAAFHARLATLIDVPEFRAWQRPGAIRRSNRAYRGCSGRLKARDALQYCSTPARRTASSAPAWPRRSTSRHLASRGRGQSRRRPLGGRGTLLHPCRSF